jgi:hypothetical protein
VSIIVIIFIVAQAYGNTCDVVEMAIADMIVVTSTLADDSAFKIEDVSLYVQGLKLDFGTASDAEIKASTSSCYTFTTQKNNNRNDKVVQGLTGDPWCCPVKATVQHMLHHRGGNSRCTVPFTSYNRGNRPWSNPRTSYNYYATPCGLMSTALVSKLQKLVHNHCGQEEQWHSSMDEWT